MAFCKCKLMALSSQKQQKGVALITAMLIAALVSVAAVAMASRQQLDVLRTGNMLEADQAYMYALAAETLAVQLLNVDKKLNDTDSLSDAWAQPLPPTLVEGGSISGSIEDMQGRFNLNNLVDAKDEPDGVQNKILQSLLDMVSRVEETVEISPFMANRITDWIDGNLNSLADGAEDLDYLGIENNPYRTANRFMVSPSELAAVMGLSISDVAALLPLVTALPESGVPVNVNTAPEMVLMSLHKDISAQMAGELVAYRKETPFEKADDFVKKLEDDYGLKDDNKLDKKLVSVNSEYFLVSGDATIGRTSLRMYSLLQRKPDGIHVLSRSIGAY